MKEMLSPKRLSSKCKSTYIPLLTMLSTDWSESYSILNSHNYDKKLFKRAFLYAIQYKQYYVCAIEYSTELHDAY
jgi:hypothetical protein